VVLSCEEAHRHVPRQAITAGAIARPGADAKPLRRAMLKKSDS